MLADNWTLDVGRKRALVHGHRLHELSAPNLMLRFRDKDATSLTFLAGHHDSEDSWIFPLTETQLDQLDDSTDGWFVYDSAQQYKNRNSKIPGFMLVDECDKTPTAFILTLSLGSAILVTVIILAVVTVGKIGSSFRSEPRPELPEVHFDGGDRKEMTGFGHGPELELPEVHRDKSDDGKVTTPAHKAKSLEKLALSTKFTKGLAKEKTCVSSVNDGGDTKRSWEKNCSPAERLIHDLAKEQLARQLRPSPPTSNNVTNCQEQHVPNQAPLGSVAAPIEIVTNNDECSDLDTTLPQRVKDDSSSVEINDISTDAAAPQGKNVSRCNTRNCFALSVFFIFALLIYLAVLSSFNFWSLDCKVVKVQVEVKNWNQTRKPKVLGIKHVDELFVVLADKRLSHSPGEQCVSDEYRKKDRFVKALHLPKQSVRLTLRNCSLYSFQILTSDMKSTRRLLDEAVSPLVLRQAFLPQQQEIRSSVFNHTICFRNASTDKQCQSSLYNVSEFSLINDRSASSKYLVITKLCVSRPGKLSSPFFCPGDSSTWHVMLVNNSIQRACGGRDASPAVVLHFSTAEQKELLHRSSNCRVHNGAEMEYSSKVICAENNSKVVTTISRSTQWRRKVLDVSQHVIEWETAVNIQERAGLCFDSTTASGSFTDTWAVTNATDNPTEEHQVEANSLWNLTQNTSTENAKVRHRRMNSHDETGLHAAGMLLNMDRLRAFVKQLSEGVLQEHFRYPQEIDLQRDETFISRKLRYGFTQAPSVDIKVTQPFRIAISGKIPFKLFLKFTAKFCFIFCWKDDITAWATADLYFEIVLDMDSSTNGRPTVQIPKDKNKIENVSHGVHIGFTFVLLAAMALFAAFLLLQLLPFIGVTESARLLFGGVNFGISYLKKRLRSEHAALRDCPHDPWHRTCVHALLNTMLLLKAHQAELEMNKVIHGAYDGLLDVSPSLAAWGDFGVLPAPRNNLAFVPFGPLVQPQADQKLPFASANNKFKRWLSENNFGITEEFIDKSPDFTLLIPEEVINQQIKSKWGRPAVGWRHTINENDFIVNATMDVPRVSFEQKPRLTFGANIDACVVLLGGDQEEKKRCLTLGVAIEVRLQSLAIRRHRLMFPVEDVRFSVSMASQKYDVTVPLGDFLKDGQLIPNKLRGDLWNVMELAAKRVIWPAIRNLMLGCGAPQVRLPSTAFLAMRRVDVYFRDGVAVIRPQFRGNQWGILSCESGLVSEATRTRNRCSEGNIAVGILLHGGRNTVTDVKCCSPEFVLHQSPSMTSETCNDDNILTELPMPGINTRDGDCSEVNWLSIISHTRDRFPFSGQCADDRVVVGVNKKRTTCCRMQNAYVEYSKCHIVQASAGGSASPLSQWPVECPSGQVMVAVGESHLNYEFLKCCPVLPAQGNCPVDSSNGKLCSGHGVCISSGQCRCQEGFAGQICGYECPRGPGGQPCSGHGQCRGNGRCECDEGYHSNKKGACSVATCREGCIHGSCEVPGTCVCEPGFTGLYCDLAKRCDDDAFTCYHFQIADDKCHPACFYSKCGDKLCEIGGHCPCPSQDVKDQNAWCHPFCSTPSCTNTNACVDRCGFLCPSDLRGDGVCDPQCNNADCEFDFGDCIGASLDENRASDEYLAMEFATEVYDPSVFVRTPCADNVWQRVLQFSAPPVHGRDVVTGSDLLEISSVAVKRTVINGHTSVYRNQRHPSELVVAFKAGDGGGTWAMNIFGAFPDHCRLTRKGFPCGQVHSGFHRLALSLAPKLTATILALNTEQTVNKILLTGHGYGGALAQAYAMHLASMYIQFRGAISVVAFGAPRWCVHDSGCMKTFQTLVPSTILFQAACAGNGRAGLAIDMIPALPPEPLYKSSETIVITVPVEHHA